MSGSKDLAAYVDARPGGPIMNQTKKMRYVAFREGFSYRPAPVKESVINEPIKNESAPEQPAPDVSSCGVERYNLEKTLRDVEEQQTSELIRLF